MTAKTAKILEEVRQLPPPEQRELIDSILHDTNAAHPTQSPGKRIADIAGKYRPLSSNGDQDHDRGFAEAILQSKNPSRPE